MHPVKAYRLAALAGLLAAPAVTAQSQQAFVVRPEPYVPLCFKDSDNLTQCFQWQAAPTLTDTASVYPPQALAAGQQGVVTLKCSIGADLRLTGCQVAGEYPTGAGFGEAALTLASRFRAGVSANGRALAGETVVTPVWFAVRASTGASGFAPLPPPAGAVIALFNDLRDKAASLGCASVPRSALGGGESILCAG